MKTCRILPALAGLALLIASTAVATGAGDPAEARLAADLVWGTNGDSPADKSLKPIPSDLEKRLSRIFKWKRYFVIEHKEFTVAPSKPARVDMSKECRIDVTRIGTEEFEIHLFGKGQLVVKKRQRIVPGEAVVLGGDDKNDDAWFVVLGLAPTKPPARP